MRLRYHEALLLAPPFPSLRCEATMRPRQTPAPPSLREHLVSGSGRALSSSWFSGRAASLGSCLSPFLQSLALLNPDIRTFIKEHRPSSLARAVQLADDWASAHYSYTSKPSFRSSLRFFKPPKKTTCSLVAFKTTSTTRYHGCEKFSTVSRQDLA
ncbi:hypothetical protein E2C01_039361 [Portunus trituberculatus]|uniref:Uncharacterized protein n=1 Tax=Portunus trituberculatus TaxID=210409 RepID=A0A5B7FJH4_PORTR|nr:hypothetical protein [Portunus trituberculatus]